MGKLTNEAEKEMSSLNVNDFDFYTDSILALVNPPDKLIFPATVIQPIMLKFIEDTGYVRVNTLMISQKTVIDVSAALSYLVQIIPHPYILKLDYRFRDPDYF